ncbi:MAG: phosphatase [Legionellaceae bacterium]|nr:phosphatase [Legionellaceae bacterium]
MNIVNNIPQMEMKADPESQAWARSARNILLLTSESIGESLTLTNENATKKGMPMFCLPTSVTLNSVMLNELIQQTYNDVSSQLSDKNSMTVSQVALIGIKKQYPCLSEKDQHKQSNP